MGIKSVFSISRYLALYFGIVFCAVLLWQKPLLLAGVYALLSLVVFSVWKNRGTWMISLAAAILGPAGEYIAVRAGAYSYSAARWSLPIWLPLAWGLTAAILLRISTALDAESR